MSCVVMSKLSITSQWRLPLSFYWNKFATSLLESSSQGRIDSGKVLPKWECRIWITTTWHFSSERVYQPKAWMALLQKGVLAAGTTGKPLQPGPLQSCECLWKDWSGSALKLLCSTAVPGSISAGFVLLWGVHPADPAQSTVSCTSLCWHSQGWNSFLWAGSSSCLASCALKHWLLASAKGQSPKMKNWWSAVLRKGFKCRHLCGIQKKFPGLIETKPKFFH